MASRTPPLSPPIGRPLVVYTFISGRPADPARGFVYPSTADGQPVFLLTKASPGADRYSRAWCGFEPDLLTFRSHLALADYVLLRQFRIGAPRVQ